MIKLVKNLIKFAALARRDRKIIVLLHTKMNRKLTFDERYGE